MVGRSGPRARRGASGTRAPPRTRGRRVGRARPRLRPDRRRLCRKRPRRSVRGPFGGPPGAIRPPPPLPGQARSPGPPLRVEDVEVHVDPARPGLRPSRAAARTRNPSRPMRSAPTTVTREAASLSSSAVCASLTPASSTSSSATGEKPGTPSAIFENLRARFATEYPPGRVGRRSAPTRPTVRGCSTLLLPAHRR